MKNYYLIIALIAAFAGVLFGYGTGIISGAILYISKEFNTTALINGVIVGSALVGAALGAMFSGLFGDCVGHKKLLTLAAFSFFFASLLTALSPALFWLLLGRICVGMAVGIISYTAPLYISEIAPSHYRGALVSLNQLAIGIGVIISYLVAYYFSFQESWRWMFGLGAIPSFVFLLGVIYLPHSPRWILAKGFEGEAVKILQKIRGNNIQIQNELDGIKARLSEDIDNKIGVFSKKFRPVLLVGLVLSAIQQVTGVNTIFYYAPTILVDIFKGEMQAISATVYIGLAFLMATIFSMLLIDKFGRRPLLLFGLLGMTISLTVLCWAFYQRNFQFKELIIILGMGFYIVSFAFSLGPITWLVIAEIFPLKIRSLGASLATALNWVCNFLVTATFLQLVEVLDFTGTFLIYLIFCAISLVFVYFFVPETKGFSLEEIEQSMVG